MATQPVQESLPDFEGKVVLIYHVGSRDLHTSSSVMNAHFEAQGAAYSCAASRHPAIRQMTGRFRLQPTSRLQTTRGSATEPPGR